MASPLASKQKWPEAFKKYGATFMVNVSDRVEIYAATDHKNRSFQACFRIARYDMITNIWRIDV